MVQAGDIKVLDELQALLASRPKVSRQRESVFIAHRASMRVLPRFVDVLNTDWAHTIGATALSVLRANLTSGSFVGNPVPEVGEAAGVSARYPDADALRSDVAFAYVAAAHAAYAARPNADIEPAHSADLDAAQMAGAYATYMAVHFAGIDTADAVWQATIRDTSRFGSDFGEFAPLWSAGPAPEAAIDDWKRARDWLSANPGHDFWIRWYEAALEGHPLTGDWESHAKLITDIALIPDADWQKGAEHVAALIAEIEERYRLLAETRRLKSELAPVAEGIRPAQMGHNRPPVGLDDDSLSKPILLTWATLDQTEKELEKREPDKTFLRRAAEILLEASIAIAKYFGKLADKALQKAAEEVGASSVKWTMRYGAGIFGAKMLGLDDVLRTFAEALARYAGG